MSGRRHHSRADAGPQAQLTGRRAMGQALAAVYREASTSVLPLLYRCSAYLASSVIDDPAMLALGFC